MAKSLKGIVKKWDLYMETLSDEVKRYEWIKDCIMFYLMVWVDKN